MLFKGVLKSIQALTPTPTSDSGNCHKHERALDDQFPERTSEEDLKTIDVSTLGASVQLDLSESFVGVSVGKVTQDMTWDMQSLMSKKCEVIARDAANSQAIKLLFEAYASVIHIDESFKDLDLSPSLMKLMCSRVEGHIIAVVAYCKGTDCIYVLINKSLERYSEQDGIESVWIQKRLEELIKLTVGDEKNLKQTSIMRMFNNYPHWFECNPTALPCKIYRVEDAKKLTTNYRC